MLSSESTDGEITWSLAEYMTGIASLAGIQAPGSPPPAYGIFANQPSPYGGNVGSVLAHLAVAECRTGCALCFLLHESFRRGASRSAITMLTLRA